MWSEFRSQESEWEELQGVFQDGQVINYAFAQAQDDTKPFVISKNFRAVKKIHNLYPT